MTCLILVILIPLPTWALDILLASNITLSAVILLTVMYVTRPLDLSIFPTLLLSTTLFRLVLNTASTRLILTHGPQGTDAAGKVIEAFGNFVAAGSLAVGVIIFTIIAVIQFVVITKGATRIAEVAARFTLDGMPGKQMAIDADLNAGLIDEAEARRRRAEISSEADFYGAMDGASKFVRGDAIAGIIITFVNILGGMYVGMVEGKMEIWQCLSTFTKLTIGEGLVAQIPAFIISVAAGMLVTRSTAKRNVGEEMLSQMSGRPVALALTAIFLGILALTPLPKLPLLLLGSSLAAIAIIMSRSQAAQARTDAAKVQATQAAKTEPVEKQLLPDPMELEVGYGLVKLVDRKQGGDLLDRITMLRRQMALDLGLIVPPIRIRDNMQIEPNRYRIKIRGMAVAQGEAMPGHLLAINSGLSTEPLSGIETMEPAFGLKAYWITEDNRSMAEHRNYTVVDASGVLTTHLTEVIKQHAAELLTRQETNRLLDNLKQKSPKAVEDLIPELLKVGEVQKVLQNLLRERVPIRDLETILETLGDWAPRTKDADVLTEYARNALARTICHLHRDENNRLCCVTLDPKLEELINGHIERSERLTYLTLPPAVQNRIVEAINAQINQAIPASGGRAPVVLCSPQVRTWVRRLIEPAMPQVAVLAYNEIVRGVEVKSLGLVVLNDESANVS
jgi:flagellar biosynthesis protein FlhA